MLYREHCEAQLEEFWLYLTYASENMESERDKNGFFIIGSQNNRYSDVLSLLLLLFTIKKHVSIKACNINDHIVYADLNTYSLVSCMN